MFDTPILLLIFNRPNHARTVLRRIREVKPKQFFIVADGPRVGNEHDQAMCQLTRDTVMELIDWECELKTLFREENLGCGLGPANGITWFFQQVEAGIILEDDCMPSLSFFTFCEVLLAKYRDSEKIFAISGFNYCEKWLEKKYDYFFSDGGNWGWASWRRAWQFFDYSMTSWEGIYHDKKKKVRDFYPAFDSIYNKIKSENYDAWDIQWHYARLYHNGLSITPAFNLVSNIGFDSAGTHTLSPSVFSNISLFEMKITEKMVGPEERKIDLKYRKKLITMGKSPTVLRRVVNALNKIVNLIP